MESETVRVAQFWAATVCGGCRKDCTQNSCLWKKFIQLMDVSSKTQTIESWHSLGNKYLHSVRCFSCCLSVRCKMIMISSLLTIHQCKVTLSLKKKKKKKKETRLLGTKKPQQPRFPTWIISAYWWNKLSTSVKLSSSGDQWCLLISMELLSLCPVHCWKKAPT